MLGLSSDPALAHSNHSRVHGIGQAEASPGDTHGVYGGYGYISGSEAEAYEALNFGCAQAEQVSYFRDACGAAEPVPTGSPSQMVTDAMRAFVVADLRRHETEFLIMQNRAMGEAAGAVPACMLPDSDLDGLHGALPETQPRFEQVAASAPDVRDRLNRYRISSGPLRSGELIRALIFGDQIEANQTKYCGGGTTNSFCTDLANQQLRIRTSFPALFETGSDSARTSLRNSLHALLGARFPDATTAADRQSRGAARYQGLVSSSDSDSLNELEKSISEAILDGVKPPASQAAAMTSAFTSATTQINGAVGSLRQNYAAVVQAALGNVCARGSIDDYIRSSPNLVRQMLNDASPRNRAMARLVLCQSPDLRSARRERACEGVVAVRRGGRLNTSVARQDWSFPYSSDVNYMIEEPRRPPENAPSIIRTTMHIRVDSSLSPEEAAAKIQEMGEQANAYYNCLTGQRVSVSGVAGLEPTLTCPTSAAMTTPPVRFDIRVERTPPAPGTPPVVELHQCYNADLVPPAKTDCAAVRAYAVTRCQNNIHMWQKQGWVGGSARFAPDMEEFLDNIKIPARVAPSAASTVGAAVSAQVLQPDYLHMTEAQLVAHCESTNPPATDGRYNREDSGNYTLNTDAGTVLHEVGHALGLRDEYQDPSYPFLPQGEHNSLMNNSDSTALLRPRHLRQIIEPRQCLRTARMRAGGAP